MRFAGLTPLGRVATRIASVFTPPYKGRRHLARLNPRGYVAPTAVLHCRDLRVGRNGFIGDRVTIYQAGEGEIALADRVFIHQDTIIEVGNGGRVDIGMDTHIQPRCQLSAYRGSLLIGADVQVAPNCAFYPYDHGKDAGQRMREQPLQTKGGIVIEDDVWLGFGVVVLDGVRIQEGAVVGAGSIVTMNIPRHAIAVGSPARVIGTRSAKNSGGVNSRTQRK